MPALLIQSHVGISDTKIQEDVPYIAALSSGFTDTALGDDVTYAATLENSQSLPDWLKINADTGVIEGTPKHDDASRIYNIIVTATSTADPSIQQTESYYLYAENVNDAPVITSYGVGTVHKLGYSGTATASITINDPESGWLRSINRYPPTTDYTSTVIDTGETVSTRSNPFGHLVTTTTGDYGSKSVYQYSSGLTAKEDYSYDDANDLATTVVTSSEGDDFTSLVSRAAGDGFTDSTTTQTGFIKLLGSLYYMEGFGSTYRSYHDDSALNEVISVAGQVSNNDTIYYPQGANSEQEVFLNQSEHGASSAVHDGHIYTILDQQGQYGTISLDENINWVYTLDMDDPDTVGLEAGSIGLESFDLVVSDGEASTSTSIQITVTGATDKIVSTDLNTSTGDNTANIITGGVSAEIINGLSGDDVLHGGGGNDVLHGDEGNDAIYGDEGSDALYAGGGADLVMGGSGSDELYLSADGVWGAGYYAFNTDTHELKLLNGKNRFTDVVQGADDAGEVDTDTLVLTDGSDAFFLDDIYSDVHASLELQTISEGFSSTARIKSIDSILGGLGDDIIDLSSVRFDMDTNLPVSVYGEEGNDTLWGGDGPNVLNGGTGNDSLNGGSGDDQLTGGSDKDTFQFTASSGNDTITDFSVSEADTLEFYYQSSSSSTIDDLSISNGVITWNTGDQSQQVQIDLSSTMPLIDISDFGGLISFHEIV